MIIFRLRIIIEIEQEEWNKKCYFYNQNVIKANTQPKRNDLYCFKDYTKDFDRVRDEQMLEILQKIGLPGKYNRVICNFN